MRIWDCNVGALNFEAYIHLLSVEAYVLTCTYIYIYICVHINNICIYIYICIYVSHFQYTLGI